MKVHGMLGKYLNKFYSNDNRSNLIWDTTKITRTRNERMSFFVGKSIGYKFTFINMMSFCGLNSNFYIYYVMSILTELNSREQIRE